MMRARPRQHEHGEQMTVVAWIRRRGHHVFSVPNAGKRSPAVAAWLRKEGMLDGVPDLVMVTLAPHTWVPVCIEMKRRDGVPSDVTEHQKRIQDIMRTAGWHVIVAFGAAQAIAELEGLGY